MGLDAIGKAHGYLGWIVEQFKPYLGERVLEVGAGVGNVTRLLLAPGRRVCALEPDGDFFRAITFGFEGEACLHRQRLDQLIATDYYDSVVMINVLEHILDHAAALQQAHRVTKPGGHLLLYVPAGDWLYSAYDGDIGHFRRYTKPQLRTILHNCGWDILTIKYMDMLGALGWYFLYRIGKGRTTPGKVSAMELVGVPFGRWLESRVRVPFGKNLLAICRKV